MQVLKSKSGKLPILIIAGALILIALGGVAFLKFKGGPKKHTKEHAPVEATTTMEMGEMVVNLADSSEPHYLKTEIVLEVLGAGGGGHGGGGEKASPKVRDAVIAVLSSRTYNELLTPKGKDSLKESIKKTVNKSLGEEKVVDVFFNDFAMQ